MSGHVIDIPPSWNEAVALVASGRAQRSLVLGPPDVGKSTFCRLLLAKLAELGRKPTLLDTDLAQKIIGPPACVTVGFIEGEHLIPGPALAFVGTVDPVRGWTRLIQGVRRLALRPDTAPGPLVANTSGLLRGPGRALKGAKIATLRPDLLIALGSDRHLDAVLADHPDVAVVRLTPSPLAHRKTDAERRTTRRAAFRAYFEGCPGWTLHRPQCVDEPHAPDLAPGLLVGLADAAGNDLGMGIVTEVDPIRDTIALVAPDVRSRVSFLRRGHLILGNDIVPWAPEAAAEPNRPAGIAAPTRPGPGSGSTKLTE